MLREPGLLRSVLITDLELAHVHAGRAAVERVGPVLRSVLTTVLDLAHVHAARKPGLAPERRAHTVAHAARIWLAPLSVDHGS